MTYRFLFNSINIQPDAQIVPDLACWNTFTLALVSFFFKKFLILFWPHGMWRLSSLTKDQACTPCSRGTDSSPLGRRGSPPVPLSHARAVSECLPTCCDSMFQVHLNISSAPALESTISARSLLVPFIGEEKIFASLSRVLYP